MISPLRMFLSMVFHNLVDIISDRIDCLAVHGVRHLVESNLFFVVKKVALSHVSIIDELSSTNRGSNIYPGTAGRPVQRATS
jgi:hypothetical protein